MKDRKRALVTGGSRGIGRAISVMLARNGHDVIINFKENEDKAKEVKDEIEKFNVNCSLLKFDVSNFNDAKKILDEEIEKNGIIDVLIFNAGVRRDVLFPMMTSEDWDKVIDVNLKSFYYIVNPIVKGMFHQNYGKIVIMSSTAGLTGMQGQSNYSSSKFGLIGAGKSLAIEVARRGVNVNIVAPGFIETDMTNEDMRERKNEILKTIPARRIGTAEDVANIVEFLVSDKSSYIIGEIISVNGGIFT